MINSFFFFLYLHVKAECDELAQRADVLNGENASLREEINKLRSQHEELVAENSALKVNLQKNLASFCARSVMD